MPKKGHLRITCDDYYELYDLANDQRGITSLDIATAWGVSRTRAKQIIYLMVFTGALIPGGRKPGGTQYYPGRPEGVPAIINLAKRYSMRTVEIMAATNPPGAGLGM